MNPIAVKYGDLGRNTVVESSSVVAAVSYVAGRPNGETTVKILVVTPIPTPYRDPFWQTLSVQPDIKLTVVYCAPGKTDRPWSASNTEFSYTRLFPRGGNVFKWLGWGNSCYWNSGVGEILENAEPDVVLVGGYNHLTILSAVRRCKRNRIPWFPMSESWQQRSGLMGRVKRKILRWWLNSAGGALPTGIRASKCLSGLGVSSDRQCFLPNVPDIESLGRFSDELQSQTSQVKVKLGVEPDQRLVVFAARMIEKKRPLLVIEAFLRLKNKDDVTLVMIGDGPLMNKAKELAGQCDDSSRIVFPGFLRPEQVHRWMAVADVFVQPSTETWGVAPIEALSCGVPVVLTDQIGCAADVLPDPSLGIVLQTVDAESLTDAMNTFLNHSCDHCANKGKWQIWSRQNTYSVLSSRLSDFLHTSVSHNEAAS